MTDSCFTVLQPSIEQQVRRKGVDMNSSQRNKTNKQSDSNASEQSKSHGRPAKQMNRVCKIR